MEEQLRKYPFVFFMPPGWDVQDVKVRVNIKIITKMIFSSRHWNRKICGFLMFLHSSLCWDDKGHSLIGRKAEGILVTLREMGPTSEMTQKTMKAMTKALGAEFWGKHTQTSRKLLPGGARHTYLIDVLNVSY